MFYLSFFLFLLFFIFRKSNKLLLFILLLHLFSLFSSLLVGNDYPLKSLKTFFNLIVYCVYLSLIILPWRYFSNINIIVDDFPGLKKFTSIILILSAFSFIILLPTAIIVSISIDDVNAFKYQGESVEFFYNSLPFDVKFYILATFLYGLGYFLIPLHFLYLQKRKYLLSILCLVFSLNIILYGLTYFSRAMVVHYALIFFAFFLLLKDTLSDRIIKLFNRILLISFVLAVLYFITISVNRFQNDSYYARFIPEKSYIQDPILYSVFDYFSQGLNNGFYVLDDYHFKIFNGQTMFQDVLRLAGQYNIINYSTIEYEKFRQELWPKHFYTFNGFVAYLIYDFGYVISLLLCLMYYSYLIRNRTYEHSLSIRSLLTISLLIQIPLFSIFYSPLNGLVIPFMLYKLVCVVSRVKLTT